MSTDKQTITDLHWLNVANTIAMQSKCSKRRVGAVIVKNGRLVATGYNGAARGFDDHGKYDCREFCPAAMAGQRTSLDDYSNCIAVHAEINSLLFANRDDLSDATIYIPYTICLHCAKAISNSGIVRVVWIAQDGEKVENDDKVRRYLLSCGLYTTDYQIAELAQGGMQ